MSRRLATVFAAALLAGPWGPTIGQEAAHPVHHSSRTGTWRQKLRNTRTTVAAMKRAARKRRNVAKRRGAA